MILLRARRESRRASSISVQALAMRSRSDGSSRAPGLTAAGRLDHGVQVGREDGDLAGDADALVAEGAHGHHPAAALLAEAATRPGCGRR